VRILVAVDGSEHSRRTVEYIARQRRMFGAAERITCLFVESPPALRAVGALGTDPGMPALAQVDSERVAAPILEILRAAGYQPELVTREGDAGVEIAQVARDGEYDLIVMGSHGRRFLKRTVLGSVARRVLAACEVPVLLVR
jgi:nucleotide-binding universal stress UspA family protein